MSMFNDYELCIDNKNYLVDSVLGTNVIFFDFMVFFTVIARR